MIDYQINLDRAYKIRAQMVEFLNDQLVDGDPVPETAVIDEMLMRHVDVPRASMQYLAARVFEHWGMPGLDYHEAPLAPGYEKLRAWYPVERDDRLERVPLDDLSDAEIAVISAALSQQGEAALAQAELLAADLA